MKIWYDKTKLDINNFKSEKFLLLPQYSNEVINRDNDFKMAELQEFKNWAIKQINLLMEVTNAGKKG